MLMFLRSLEDYFGTIITNKLSKINLEHAHVTKIIHKYFMNALKDYQMKDFRYMDEMLTKLLTYKNS